MNKKALKDIGIVITGKTPSKKEPKYFDGDIPFITPAELGKSQFVYSSPQTLTELGAAQIKMLPENTVMMCCIGSLGKCAIAGKAMATNQQINSIIFDENKVYYKYGFYAVQQLKPLMEHLAPATTVQILNKSSFEKLEIPVPSLDEQHHIAQTLDQATNLIEKRKAQIAELDKLVKAVFLETIRKEKTELCKISDVVDFISTGKSYAKLSESKYKVLKTSAVSMGFLKVDECNSLPNDYIPPKEHTLQENDILVSRMNTTELVGASAFCWRSYPTIAIPDRLWKLNTNEKVNNIFLWKSIQSDSFREKIRNQSSGTSGSMQNISQKAFMDLEIQLPNLEIQILFAQKVCKIEAEKDRLQRSLVEMENNLTALMGQFFG